MPALSICICGESGTGKSTSLRNLNPEETFIVSIAGKPLPFKGWRKQYVPIKIDGQNITGNYYTGSKWTQVVKIMDIVNKKMPHIKVLIIDDLQYVMAFEFVDRALEKGYDKYNELAQHIVTIFRKPNEMRDDLTVVFLTHSTHEGPEMDPKYTLKTLGKLTREKVTPEGLFTCMLFTKVNFEDDTPQYKFITNNNGECIAKSPMGMFDSLEIDNDLNEVIKAVRKYEYGD